MLSGKDVLRIRREPIDRMFVGTHSQKVVGTEAWYEMTHLIKGATFAAEHVLEKNGDGGNIGDAGFLPQIVAEPAQNTWDDYSFYDEVCNGYRNVAIVTGNGARKLIRLFRLAYLGSGQWADNRIYLITDDNYNNSMDKASLKSSGWVQSYERYMISDIALANKKLNFTILQGAGPSGYPIPGPTNGS